MCGLYDGVLGVEKNSCVERIIYQNKNARFKQLEKGSVVFSAIILKFDDISFKPIEIIPIYNISEV